MEGERAESDLRDGAMTYSPLGSKKRDVQENGRALLALTHSPRLLGDRRP